MSFGGALAPVAVVGGKRGKKAAASGGKEEGEGIVAMERERENR